MEYISLKTAPRGDRRARARAKKKANKGSWLQRKDYFKKKKKRHETVLKGMSSEMEARPGGGKICVIFLKSRFTAMLVLTFSSSSSSSSFQITARVAREDQTSRAVLFIFYHPSFSLRRERKRRSERQPHWETGGKEGKRKTE